MVEKFDGTADAVYSRFGVMFFSDATRGFRNLLRALRPGGRIGFVCWQTPQENPWVSVPLTGGPGATSRFPFGTDPTAPGPFSLGDADRLRSVLADAGFEQIELAPRALPAHMGDSMDEAIDFVSKLMPVVGALEANEPEKAAALRAEVAKELAVFDGPNGVDVPSAAWIVTARRPSA